MGRRTAISQQAKDSYAADAALAEQFDDLLAAAQVADQALRGAQAARASGQELRRLGKRLDAALTAAMRAAFAAQRAAIGPRGYDDRIYRRKAMATPPVRLWAMEAQRLLTLRESHRLTVLVRLPRTPAHAPAAEVIDPAVSPGASPAPAAPAGPAAGPGARRLAARHPR